jgi:NAD(P)-dependent dehydrogenase (short-subunit alcohol dehydrogenase family)
LFSLENRTVLITGANCGLGKHLAVTLLAKAGADEPHAYRRVVQG